MGIVGVAGFLGGMKYQSSKPVTTASLLNSSQGANLPNNQGFLRSYGYAPRGNRGTIGTVTAVSASSITVNSLRQNNTVTYAITSATTIMNGSSAGSVSDIATGDRVLVTPDSTTPTNASRIIVSPSFGGPPGGGAAMGAPYGSSEN